MRSFVTFSIVCSVLFFASSVFAADPSIKEIMVKAHKPPTNLLRNVAQGKASAAEKAELLALYKVLAKSEPPKGDKTSWAERTGLLVTAAQAAVDGDADAGKQLTKVSSCATCHDAHK